MEASEVASSVAAEPKAARISSHRHVTARAGWPGPPGSIIVDSVNESIDSITRTGRSKHLPTQEKPRRADWTVLPGALSGARRLEAAAGPRSSGWDPAAAAAGLSEAV